MKQSELDMSKFLESIVDHLEEVLLLGPQENDKCIFVASADDSNTTTVSNFFNGDTEFLFATIQSLLMIICKNSNHTPESLGDCLRNVIVDLMADEGCREVFNQTAKSILKDKMLLKMLSGVQCDPEDKDIKMTLN